MREQKGKLNIHIKASIGMFVFGFSLLFLVLGLNYWAPEKKQSKSSQVNFAVTKLKPKKKIAQKKKIKNRKKPKKTNKLRPKLSQALAGASYGLELYSMDLNDISDSLIGAGGDGVMSEGSVDVKPKVVSRNPLEFPDEAKAKGLKGNVTLRMLINANGRVDQVKVFSSQPKGVFDLAAVESARGWLFEPAKYQGRKVAVWVKQKIRFEYN